MVATSIKYWQLWWQVIPNSPFFSHSRGFTVSELTNQSLYHLLSFCYLKYKHTESLPVESSNQEISLGLPWWCSGWESACQCRGHGFEPWSGKIPHTAEQLGPWATTIEPASLEPLLRNKIGRDSERPAHRDEEWPALATTRESPRTETKTQHSPK